MLLPSIISALIMIEINIKAIAEDKTPTAQQHRKPEVGCFQLMVNSMEILQNR